MLHNNNLDQVEVILGNSNPRFSGVTSTMLQTLEEQQHLVSLRVMGPHHLPDPSLNISFRDTIKLCRKPLASGKYRVFHARRNDEMIQALLLKHVFGCKIKIAFTSTAQRHHSKFTKWLISRMDGIISTCKAAASYLNKAPDIIIPHGIRTDQYYPAQDKAALWQELGYPGQRGIGIFGRVRKQKGVDLFVDACIEVLPEYPDYTAIIVGAINKDNEPFVNQLKEKIAQAKLTDRILFIGEQPFDKIPVLFRAMSVVTALSDNEGFGLTPLEAMASGASVIATTAGAWGEIINDGEDGLIIPIRNKKALVERMQTVLNNEIDNNKLIDNAQQKIAEYYTVKREASELCNYYHSLQN